MTYRFSVPLIPAVHQRGFPVFLSIVHKYLAACGNAFGGLDEHAGAVNFEEAVIADPFHAHGACRIVGITRQVLRVWRSVNDMIAVDITEIRVIDIILDLFPTGNRAHVFDDKRSPWNINIREEPHTGARQGRGLDKKLFGLLVHAVIKAGEDRE